MNLKYSVGIDISKKDFKACFLILEKDQSTKIKASRTFENTDKGFGLFMGWYEKLQKESLPTVFVIEATSVYHECLAWFLHRAQQDVCVVLPNRAKAFLKSLGHKSKNDKMDAIGLAKMGAAQRLTVWHPISDRLYELRSLTRHREDLQKISTSLICQQKTFAQGRLTFQSIDDNISLLLEQIQSQIDVIDLEIAELIAEDPQLAEKVAMITSIKGVSLLTAAVIIAETDGFALITNAKQLISYAGYDVKESQSGSKQGKSSISKKGNSHIRRALYFPAISAIHSQGGIFQNLYERVYDRTGIKMKGCVAVQAKLLKIIYALWKKNECFDGNYLENRHPAINI